MQKFVVGDKMKIGVYGSAGGKMQKGLANKARELGKAIARGKHVLVTGGCLGLPYEAVLGAHEKKGECIAFSPAVNLEEHVKKYSMPRKGFTDFVFVPENYGHAGDKRICLKYRNVSSVAAVDAAIIISGRIGTMNELTIAYDLGKRIGVLEDTGGITGEAIKVLLRDARKDTGALVMSHKDPETLVEIITEEKRLRMYRHVICTSC